MAEDDSFVRGSLPYRVKAQVAFNLLLPREHSIPNEFRLVGLKTHPTMVPRSAFELTTSCTL